MENKDIEDAVNAGMDKAIGALFKHLILNGVSQEVLQKSLADMMDDMIEEDDDTTEG